VVSFSDLFVCELVLWYHTFSASQNRFLIMDKIQRFSNRVVDYINYRPSYPAKVISMLTATCGLQSDSVIADLGSGTGLLTKLFLDNGNRVYGVEPNAEMRVAGEQFLAEYSDFISVNAPAEMTTLSDHSVDFVTAGQAFHWFDPPQATAEFRRILKPGGWVALIWNERQIDTPFLTEYEALLLTHAIDYQQVDHRNVDKAMLTELLGTGLHVKQFPNQQRFDWVGLKGRVMSSSYCPLPDHPEHAPLMTGLQAAFMAHQIDSQVLFDYLTHVYYCQV